MCARWLVSILLPVAAATQGNTPFGYPAMPVGNSVFGSGPMLYPFEGQQPAFPAGPTEGEKAAIIYMLQRMQVRSERTFTALQQALAQMKGQLLNSMPSTEPDFSGNSVVDTRSSSASYPRQQSTGFGCAQLRAACGPACATGAAAPDCVRCMSAVVPGAWYMCQQHGARCNRNHAPTSVYRPQQMPFLVAVPVAGQGIESSSGTAGSPLTSLNLPYQPSPFAPRSAFAERNTVAETDDSAWARARSNAAAGGQQQQAQTNDIDSADAMMINGVAYTRPLVDSVHVYPRTHFSQPYQSEPQPTTNNQLFRHE